jgi:hypothetical protein
LLKYFSIFCRGLLSAITGIDFFSVEILFINETLPCSINADCGLAALKLEEEEAPRLPVDAKFLLITLS